MVALGVEALAVACVAIGAIEAVIDVLRHVAARSQSLTSRRDIWLRFAGWILLSLEFALGADVIRTAIAPSWDDVGKLGAIAAIRTALSFFLARDIESAIEPEKAV
ncbi:MAG TPA: DUF1622 domain-containing protein [Sphingomicrobium sp.]|nr:DUF1622 domain-containing protein [Sphingomicrobium sp.]